MSRSDEAAEGVRRVIEAAEALAEEIEAEARQKAEQIEADARERVGAGDEQARAAEDRLEQANRELERIQSVLAGLRPSATGEAEAAAATAHEEPPQEPGEAAHEGTPEPEPEEPDLEPEPETVPSGGEPGSAGGGGEGARLIALNMALTGTPREETARYLEENFEVEDPEALLDDVYSRAG